VIEELRELWRYRELILILVRRDLRVRYKNSRLGFVWSVVPMLLQVAVLTLIVRRVYHVGPANLSAYLLCAYIPWNFFQISLLDGTSSVIGQYALMKKVYFPREALPIAAVLSNLVHLLLSLGVFLVYVYTVVPLLYGWPGWPPVAVVWLPVLVVIAFLLTLGIVFFTATWNVFYEDVKFMVQSGLSLLFFVLPIMWFTEQVFYAGGLKPDAKHHAFQIAYNAFPLSWLIQAFRQVLLQRATLYTPAGQAIITAAFDYRWFLWALLVSVLVAAAGYRYFNRRKWAFVERY
jgi:ABC-type polysaccharide/polyol phosphate export permease